MSTRYVVELSDNGGGTWFARHTHTRVGFTARFWRFLLRSVHFKIRGRGERWVEKPFITRRAAWDRTRNRTAFNDYGFKMFVQRRRDGRVLSVHKVEVAEPVADLGAHEQINKAYALLRQRFGTDGIANGGIYFCRFIEGTRTVSYHGYKGRTGARAWLGAAGDVFSRPDTMSDLVDRAMFLRARVRSGELRLDRIIVGNTYWTSEDGMRNPHFYSGVFHRHVHFEVHSGGPCNP